MKQNPLELQPTQKKRWKILGVEFVYLWLFGIFVAFLGWAGENAIRGLRNGVIDSRFHLLPFISPYALIGPAIHIVLGDPDDLTFFGKKLFKQSTAKTRVLSNLICYAILCAGVFFGELVVGNLWEVLFGIKMWDYSGWPMTVTQYTSIVTTVGFGTAAYVILRFVYQPMMRFIRTKVPFRVAKWICCTLGIVIVLDTLWMMLQMALWGEAPIYWSITFTPPLGK